MERSPARREAVADADDRHDRGPNPPAAVASTPARRAAPSPAAVLALQRTIGNAGVTRLLQRVFADDFRTLLGTPTPAGAADAGAALAGLQGRAFTRQDARRWVTGQATTAEWLNRDFAPTLTALDSLGRTDMAPQLADLANADALQELQALAVQQLTALDALLLGGANAGAPWRAKFNAMRTALVASKLKIDPMNYATALGGNAPAAQDAWRATFAKYVERKLEELRRNELEIRIGGRLKFSQKRANARFSSAATIHNEETSRLVAGKRVTKVAEKLRAGTITPDQIPVRVFFHNGELIAINNRGLAALSLAGFRPTNVIFEPAPEQDLRNRLGESDTFSGAGTITSPDFRMALTETDAATDRAAVAVPVTV